MEGRVWRAGCECDAGSKENGPKTKAGGKYKESAERVTGNTKRAQGREGVSESEYNEWAADGGAGVGT